MYRYMGVRRTAGYNNEKSEKENREDAELLLEWHADPDDLGDGETDDYSVSCRCKGL